MGNAFFAIRWLAVLAAFVPYFVLGGFWFTVLFARPYRVSLGRETGAAEKPTPLFIVGPAVCSLIITVATALLMRALHIDSFVGALAFGIVVGFGHLVANTVNIAINPNIPRPLLYGLISGGFHMTGILIVCTVLVAMG